MEDIKSGSLLPSLINGTWIGRACSQYIDQLQARRAALSLPNPGTVDNVNREVHKDVFLTKQMFTGLRADFNRPLSLSPLFQYSHAFALGSQGFPPYGFSALIGTKEIFMQGNVDNDGQLGATLNYQWSPALVTKCQASIASADQSMLQLDTEYTGSDFSASLKSINPSMLDGSPCGIYIGSYLQSVTRSLAVGTEVMYQRSAMNQGPEAIVSYCARYKGLDWIASAQLQAQGALSTSYWRRLTDKVEAGVDLGLHFTPGLGGSVMGAGARRECTTTIGAKYDFRTSTFRAQMDSTGKVSALLEKRVLPPVQVTFAGEMDHVKSTSKVGVSVSIETTPEEVAMQATSNQPTSVPF